MRKLSGHQHGGRRVWHVTRRVRRALTLLPLSATTMSDDEAPEVLQSIGIGGEHAVWRYVGQDEWDLLAGCVLRLRLSADDFSPLRRPDDSVGSMPYAETGNDTALPALKAALGPEYLQPPLALLELPASVASQLLASARCGADPPEWAQERAIDEMKGAVCGLRRPVNGTAGLRRRVEERTHVGWVERDHTRAHEVATEGICIEIKPKAGVLPPAAPLARIQPRRCRFCLYAQLKDEKKRGKAAASSSSSEPPQPPSRSSGGDVCDYCPLDLYAGTPDRTARAVDALLRKPRNNLRIFDSTTTKLLLGGAAGGVEDSTVDAALTGAGYPPAVLRAILGDEGLLPLVLHGKQEGSSTGGEYEFTAPSGPSLLDRLRSVQARTTIGSERAMEILERATVLASGDERLKQAIEARQASCSCSGASCKCAGMRQLDESVTLLCEWLLSLAASDVSIMITLTRTPPAEQSTARWAPPIAASVGDTKIWWRCAVVDTSAKPLRKVREHRDIDAMITEDWTKRGAAMNKVTHVCELLPGVHHAPGPAEATTLIIALGTRGDVLPLLAIARAIINRNAGEVVLFATHRCHEHLLKDDNDNKNDSHFTSQLRFIEVPTSPMHTKPSFLLGDNGHSSSADDPANDERWRFNGSLSDQESPASHSIEAEYEPIVAAVQQLQGGETGRRAFDARNEAREKHPLFHRAKLEGLQPVRLVVFNLFSLGGYHIAEMLGVPCIAISPCLVPYTPPASFDTIFRRNYRKLYAALNAEANLKPPGQLNWSDVKHWMWPLWDVVRWGHWRVRRLGLTGLTPFDQGDKVHRYSDILPKAPPLLYAYSPTLVPRPAYWPDSVKAVGFIAEEVGSKQEARCMEVMNRYAPITSALRDPSEWSQASQDTYKKLVKPLYMGFGSSSPLLSTHPVGENTGVVIPGSHLAEDLAIAALSFASMKPRPLILHSCGNIELKRRWEGALVAAGCTLHTNYHPRVDCEKEVVLYKDKGGLNEVRIILVHCELALEWVFRRCEAVIHHGGSGTCAAALRTATPQVIFPLLFDQFSNAERLEHVEAGYCLQRAVFEKGLEGGNDAGATLASAVARAKGMNMKARRGAIEAERGLDAALQEIDALAPALPSNSSNGGGASSSSSSNTGAAPLMAAANRWKRARTEEDDVIEDAEKDGAPPAEFLSSSAFNSSRLEVRMPSPYGASRLQRRCTYTMRSSCARAIYPQSRD